MDIRQMIDFHLSKDAAVTVAARPVPIEEASAFGVIVSDSEHRIVSFQEKPRQPVSTPDDPKRSYVSMGNYIFNRKVLEDALARAQRKKQNDFGAHVLPDIVDTGKIFAYDFSSNIIPGTTPYEEKGYWRDVGTISAYFDANMDILGRFPNFEIDNVNWPIHPSRYEGPSARILSADIKNSMLAEGVFIQKARIVNSIISSGVTIESGVSVEDCIIMERTLLKKGCRLKRVIVDKMNVIEEDERIGFDTEADRFRCHIDSSGIAIVPKGGRTKRTYRPKG
jgi:glucose-1-phosphate adenylyltransferase